MKRIALTIVLLGVFCTLGYASESAVLVVRAAPDDFFTDAVTDDSQTHEHRDGYITVIGLINMPSFSIAQIGNVTVRDARSRQIQLVVDSLSIYREFDDINQMRVAFQISEEALAAGSPTLVWGPDITADNIEIDRILVDGTSRERYRTFSWEECAGGVNQNSQVATIEVVVDDTADLYYLWYLLPMGLIFLLLALRRLRIDRSPETTAG